ncbi:hypothetical protein Smp_181780, partial [Schistosoma mansoni]|uniref:hypothetical protein n=1 Tax=Schistosoma mansoni TaxID=6183 RepID=UPI0001A61D48
ESFPGFYGFDLYRPLCGDTYEASETKPSTAFFDPLLGYTGFLNELFKLLY